MAARIRDPVGNRQRHIPTEFRLNVDMETLAERIRALRAEKKMSRDALARAAGIAYTTLADIESGRQRSSTRLYHIAAALGVSVYHLETGEADEGPDLKLTPREEALMVAFRAASPEGKLAIEGAAIGVSRPARKNTNHSHDGAKVPPSPARKR